MCELTGDSGEGVTIDAPMSDVSPRTSCDDLYVYTGTTNVLRGVVLHFGARGVASHSGVWSTPISKTAHI